MGARLVAEHLSAGRPELQAQQEEGADGAQQRVQIALALCVWEAAKDGVIKQNEMEAEQRALGFQKKMFGSQYFENLTKDTSFLDVRKS